jgi:hypothetical protein
MHHLDGSFILIGGSICRLFDEAEMGRSQTFQQEGSGLQSGVTQAKFSRNVGEIAATNKGVNRPRPAAKGRIQKGQINNQHREGNQKFEQLQ